MSGQRNRLAGGGRIDRSRSLGFSFDGKRYQGHPGDTLASAMLANGVKLVGRSFKYHRPRGISTAGVEEPNALVTLHDNGRREPNTPVTTVELYDELRAESQNRYPSLRFDVNAVNGLLSPIFSAGFYYKTFMGPRQKSWMFYEPFIRKAAGLGRATRQNDPDRYEKMQAFCDVLVVGGGPAGIAAALAAGRAGARVILAEQQPALGGALLDRPLGDASDAWLEAAIEELESLETVEILTRTSAFGVYDSNVVGLIERVADHMPAPEAHGVRQRYWTVRPRQLLFATGAIERPLVFGNNDLPGVMLASAARSYLNRHAVLPGRQAVVFTNNDSAYAAACELARAGAEVTVVDPRESVAESLGAALKDCGAELLAGHVVSTAHGRQALRSLDIGVYDAATGSSPRVARQMPCDLLCVSGGWSPSVHLLSHQGSKPVYDQALTAFVPGKYVAGQSGAGALEGRFALADCVVSGSQAGLAAAQACGFQEAAGVSAPDVEADAWQTPILPLWEVPAPEQSKRGKKFVDQQNDVTSKDVALAHREGYVSVEHLKRYTTLGMATDQGKTANVNALALMAALRGETIDQVGTTTFRPPYTGVAIGALTGQEVGREFKPIRRTAMHDWHEANGAVFTEAGPWLRPWYYPKPGEGVDAAYEREAAQVRKGVGIVDVSTLGKIEVQGPDAAEFLNRVYVNGFAKLAVGKARYGLMLRDDGIVMDDGTTTRLGEHHYFMTTTTANAGKVMSYLEFLLQTAWPELKVQVTSVSEQWAGIAIAGPRSRDLLEALITGADLSNEALPFMGVTEGTAGDISVRIYRISFSGELAYEINTPSDYGEALWQATVDAGRDLDLVLYGTEALGALRIEKGHVAGPELDGRTTLDDLGLERMASTKKPYVGSVLRRREGLVDEARPRLVGLIPEDHSVRLRAGAILCDADRPPHGHGQGHVTSVTYSPALGHWIGLGLLSGGPERHGEVVNAVNALKDETIAVRVTSPHFFDPKGERMYA